MPLPSAFDAWFQRVNAIMESRIGLTAEDVEDWDWYGLFDSELTPSQAVDDWFANMADQGFDVHDIF